MAVRFIIGRAGSGKTALCMREIRAEMVRHPLSGGALLWIVPEQGTFSAERLLLTAGGAGPRGMFRAQVLGFRRLALLIAHDTGILAAADGGIVKPLDEIARGMLLEEIVRRERENLTVFRAAAERPGFVARLDGTLRELRQHGHSGASLRALAEGGLEPVMTRKLLDLAILLDAWAIELQKAGNWDFESVMHAAALKAGESPLIAGRGEGPAHVWVDAFSEMSALEIRMLAALGTHARDLTITLLADPESPAMRDHRLQDEGGLFARPERLHRRIVDEFRRHQVRIASTVALRERFRFADPAIAHLEANLFADQPQPFVPQVPAIVRDDASPATQLPVSVPAPTGARGRGKPALMLEQPSLFDAVVAHQEPKQTDEGVHTPMTTRSPGLPSGAQGGGRAGVEIWECGDPETEVRAVARAIRGLILGGDGVPALRCRQIAVIVPDLEGYHDALRRIFTEHGIPHFIDRRRGIAHHPLVELLRSALAIVASHWDRDDVMLYLKTSLAGVSHMDVSLVENYAIEHGISHRSWEVPWTWIAPNEHEDQADADTPQGARERLAQVNAVRAKVWGDLQAFVEACPETAGAACPQALRALLTQLNVEAQLQKWVAAARATGDSESAQIHEQAGREVLRIIDLLTHLLAERTRTLAEFQRLLESALEQLTLGLIPPTVDQVLVSSVDRSRVPEMEAVFVIGAVEGQFPKVLDEDPILSDDQRAVFNAHAADPIGEGASRRLLEMPFLDYVALTRSRHLLIVTHPLADGRGKALAPSRHVARLRSLLPQAPVRQCFSTAKSLTFEHIGTADDLVANAAAWARQALGARAGEDPLMPALYNRIVTSRDPQMARARVPLLRALTAGMVAALSDALAARLFPPGAVRMSISQLERFAGCPLQYFAHYTLGLRPRAEFQLDSLGMGSLVHEIVERVYQRIIAEAFVWPGDDAALRAAVEEEVENASGDLHAEIAEQTPGYDKTRARLKRVLGIMLESDRRRHDKAGSDFRPLGVEVFFGSGDAAGYRGTRLVSLPVLSIPTGTRVLQVHGKIDRIDRSGDGKEAVVIDYKSSTNRKMELVRVRHGLSLQLPVYSHAVSHLAGFVPAGMFYLNLGLTLEKIAHPDAARDAESDGFHQKFKPQGWIDATYATRFDSSLGTHENGGGVGKSEWYRLTFKKDGGIYQNSDLLEHDDFATVLKFSLHKLGDLATALGAGRIAPDPYRYRKETPCDHCEFAGLCTFDRAGGAYREITSGKRDEMLADMQEELLRPTTRGT